MGGAHHRAALLAGHPVPALCGLVPALRRPFGVRDRIDDAGAVALTFDDGPDAYGTPAALDALAAAGTVATFFVTGEQVRARPAVATAIAAAGHEVGVHGDRHRNLLRVGPRALRDDLRRAEAAIADATGVAPRLYRPPYGVLSAAALALAREYGWEPVLWTRWGRDWRAGATAAGVAAAATRRLTGGEIVLLHDADRYSAPGCWRTTVAALPAIVAAVRAAGLEPGRIPAAGVPAGATRFAPRP